MFFRSLLLSLLAFGLATALGCGSAPDPVELPVQAPSHPCFDKNNLDACMVLGKRVLSQSRPDYAKARRLLSRTCLVKNPEGCALFGELLQEGMGGPIDLQRAADALTVGCEGGQETACLNLASLYNNPLNERRDPAQAKRLLQQLCTGDTPSSLACQQLGEMYSDPNTSRDAGEALTHHRTACGLGEKNACVAAATIAIGAETTNVTDRAAAVSQLESLCEEDTDLGCFELASLHEAGKIPGGSSAQAAVLYRAVCDHDAPRGCYEAGQLYERGLIQSRAFEAAALYTRGCENGHDKACERRSVLAALQEAAQQ